MSADSGRIRLGELLLRAGVITEEQLQQALVAQKKWGGKLGTILVEKKIIDEDLLIKALSRQLDMPRIDFKGLTIPRQALAKIPVDFADSNQVLPVALDVGKNQLLVAVADPYNMALIDDIAFQTGCRVVPALAGPRALASAIREHYYSEDVVSAPDLDDGGEGDFKLLNSQGSTRVSKIDDLRAEVARNAAAAPAPAPAPAPVAAPPVAVPAVAPRTVAGITSSEFAEHLNRFEAIQQKEVRVLKAVVELLIQKNYITRQEYREAMDR